MPIPVGTEDGRSGKRADDVEGGRGENRCGDGTKTRSASCEGLWEASGGGGAAAHPCGDRVRPSPLVSSTLVAAWRGPSVQADGRPALPRLPSSPNPPGRPCGWEADNTTVSGVFLPFTPSSSASPSCLPPIGTRAPPERGGKASVRPTAEVAFHEGLFCRLPPSPPSVALWLPSRPVRRSPGRTNAGERGGVDRLRSFSSSCGRAGLRFGVVIEDGRGEEVR